jgi:rod shape determining protein RodA
MTQRQSWVRKIDFPLILITLGLVAVSLVALYSLGSGSTGSAAFTVKQLTWVAAGLAVMAAVAWFDYGRLRNYTVSIYVLNLIFLFSIIVSGKTALGAQRWIELGGFRFQPSEFSKLFVIITLAVFLSQRKGEIAGWRDTLLALAHVAPSIVLILLQPDLGTALVLSAIVVGMLFAAGIPPKQLAVLGGLAYLAAAAVFKFGLLHDYQMTRLVVFLNPEVDPLGSGYNLRQSIIAIGSGGMFGKGLFSGTQSRLDFLPPAVRHTDFIFAVIGEELGLIGGIGLVLLFFLLVSRGLMIGSLARSYFGLLIATGIVSMWVFQIVVNIGMTIGIMPITGIPLPLVSYGGSSMLMNLMAVGLLLSVYAHKWR